MGAESHATILFCSDFKRRGGMARALVGSSMQVGLPDRYFLSIDGRHRWLEFKIWGRKRIPERIDWLALFGSHERSLQDEFIREVCAKDRAGARVCVIHADDPARWVLYKPAARPEYELDDVAMGRDAIMDWLCGG